MAYNIKQTPGSTNPNILEGKNTIRTIDQYSRTLNLKRTEIHEGLPEIYDIPITCANDALYYWMWGNNVNLYKHQSSDQMVFAPSCPTPSTRSDSPILCSKTFAPYLILFFSCLRMSTYLLNESFSCCSYSHNFLNSSATSVKCSIISFYKSVCSLACSYWMCVIAGRNICSSFSSKSDCTRIWSSISLHVEEGYL